jgi:hypothetical protein
MSISRRLRKLEEQARETNQSRLVEVVIPWGDEEIRMMIPDKIAEANRQNIERIYGRSQESDRKTQIRD